MPKTHSEPSSDPLDHAIETLVRQYFHDLEGEPVQNLYAMVLARVEAPLLRLILDKAESNQTHAAAMLGLNRNTLRKKMKQYNLL